MSKELIVPEKDETKEPEGGNAAASALDEGVNEVLGEDDERSVNDHVIDVMRQSKKQPNETTRYAMSRDGLDLGNEWDQEVPDPIANGINEARERGRQAAAKPLDESNEPSRRYLEPISRESEVGGEAPPPDGPTEPPSGDNGPEPEGDGYSPAFASVTRQSSSWLKLISVLILGIMLVAVGLVAYKALKKRSEIPPTEPTAEQVEQAKQNTERSSYVERSTFNESQAAQDGRINQNDRAIGEIGDRVETLEDRPALSSVEVAKQSASSARSQVRPVEERVSELERRLGDTIRSIPGMVNSEATEQRLQEVEDAMLRNKDAIDVHQVQITEMNRVIEGQQDVLKVHETRLREAEKAIDRHTIRLDELERKFEELSGARRMSIQIQCARINGGGSPNPKHHADVLALVGNDRQAAKDFCRSNFSPN